MAMENDKVKHLSASAAISSGIYLASRENGASRFKASAAALALTLLVGAIKETQDVYFDQKDMQANAAGAAAGVLLPISFSF